MKLAIPLGFRSELPPEILPTGIPSADNLMEGCPRGRITEVSGPVSSGRTTFLYSVLTEATRRGEFCALIDAANTFDPGSASQAGVDLGKLVWVRCSGNGEHAFRAADLLIHGGGFGVVAMDLADLAPAVARRIPAPYWFRFRRAVEDTPAVLLVLSGEPMTKSCASLLIAMERGRAVFRGKHPTRLLHTIDYKLNPRKPVRQQQAEFTAAVAG
ncbi:MAG: DNA recombination/repair protein RecA [Bryobacteraceae bacterium]|nr:DNA recombination/repair protein RecA [Bryobacteraceae bacterium]